MATYGAVRRRGLPRVPGGAPWPETGAVAGAAIDPVIPVEDQAVSPAPVNLKADTPVSNDARGARTPVRRGLPRVIGGEPWPAAGFWPAHAEKVSTSNLLASSAAPAPDMQSEHAELADAARASNSVSATPAAQSDASKHSAAADTPQVDDRYLGPFTRRQQIFGASLLAGIALIAVAAVLVLGARWLVSFDAVQEFLLTYPGETHLPDSAPVGFPAWLAWQHFFNAFLMLLIIRTGWRIRHEERPPAYWTGRRGKVSLTVWLHQSLDLLWLVNGLVFIVLLFVSGQWMRVVPMSWDVIPNALSALLQYVSLDWPTENGWVNYNSLQVLAYFTTIFIAAPLAAVTGFRLSAFWPKNSSRLTRWFPIERARLVHFPVMLYFAVFIVVHVALVLSTGALRNLNHMYAAQGSLDPTAFADNWTGFILFVVSLAVMVAAMLLARPALVSVIARRFGAVTSR